jgi:hypothetical protein
MKRIFVLSPANCNGLRARWILRKNSRSEMAQRLRGDGAPLGDVFSFLSALYFRGKLAYAQSFAEPPSNCPGIFIITPTAGLVPHDTMIRLARLRGFSRGRIHLKNRNYCSSLRRSAIELAARMGSDCELVLLGSLATGKYLEILTPVFENRLRVPEEFIGRGDMSRGGLLLRCVKDKRQLNYIDAATACSSLPQRGRANTQRILGVVQQPRNTADTLTPTTRG